MYNQSMMFNPLEYNQVPHCPFMRSMYMTPDLMRSEELEDNPNSTFPEEIHNLTDNLRENFEDDNIEYTNLDNENEPREDNISTQFEENLNKTSVEVEYDENQFRLPNNPDRILRMIERNNPMIIRRMVMYGIPYPVALNMIRRIINLTLQYYR